MRATCRSRAVGSRSTPSASATSWPCAQVSISRPVAIEATLIGGPYQGRRTPSGCSASTRPTRSRPARQRASSSAGGRAAPRAAPSSTKESGAASAASMSGWKASAPSADRRAQSSVHARWAIWWAIVHPAAGVGAAHRSGAIRATRLSSASPSARRSPSTSVGPATPRSPHRVTESDSDCCVLPRAATRSYARTGRACWGVPSVAAQSERGSARRNNQA